MTMYPERRPVPALTLGWRLRMAIETSGKPVKQVADELGVSTETMRRWTHDLGQPKRGMLKQIGLATGLPWRWLETGEESGEDIGPDEPAARSDNPPITDREAA